MKIRNLCLAQIVILFPFILSPKVFAQPLVTGPSSSGTVSMTLSGRLASPDICRRYSDGHSAPMSVFSELGPYFKNASGGYEMRKPSTRCATRIGEYSDGVFLGSANGKVRGKYLITNVLSFPDLYQGAASDDIPEFTTTNNQYLVPLTYGDPLGSRQSVLWLSQTNAYYHITEYIDRFLTQDLQAIGLDPARIDAVVNKGYREDYPSFNSNLVGTPPYHVVLEDYVDGPFSLYPDESLQVAPSLARIGGNLPDLDPLSYSFDSAFTVGEHMGLRAFALTKTNQGFPSEFGFGYGWTSDDDVSATLNDALNLWVAFDYGGSSNVANNFWYIVRQWTNHLNPSLTLCDRIGKPSCLSGNQIDSVLSFQYGNTSRDGIFPPRQPDTYQFGEGATSSDLAAIFIASIFYEYSLFVGKRKATQLFLKLISEFDDIHFGNLSMHQFGSFLLNVADEYYRESGAGGRVEVLQRILVKKGVPYIPSDNNIENYIPAAVGNFPESLEKNSGNKFGSSFPETHPTVDNAVVGPGSSLFFSNGYFVPNSPIHQGIALQLWEGSRYGPCDYLAITDGSFVGSAYQEDGSYYHELRGRGLENAVVIVPGDRVRWLRVRKKCMDWNEGDYTNDFRPPGFRVIQAEQNGYSFKVRRLSETSSSITYQFQVVDPLAAYVPGMAEVNYSWRFVGQEGQFFSFNAPDNEPTSAIVTLPKNQSVTIHLDRILAIEAMMIINQIESYLSIFERTNDLDRAVDGRPEGEAFVVNLVQP